MTSPYAANLAVAKFAFPMRFLGFGFYWAWMTTFWTGTVRSPLAMPTVDQTTLARVAVQTATAVAFLLAFLLARRLTSFSGQRLLVLTGAVLGPAGTVVARLGQEQAAGRAPVYVVLAWVSLGVACACITLLWGRFYASVGLKRASLYTPLSWVLAVVVGFVLSSMQSTAAIVITTALPLLSIGMFQLAAPELAPRQEHTARTRREPLGVLWRISLAIGVYGAALGFYLHSAALFGEGSPWPSTGRLVALCVPLVTVLLLRKSNLGLIFRITLPLTAAGFLLLPLLGSHSSWIGATVVGAGGTFFDIITWIALSEIAHRGKLCAVTVFGLGRAANAGGIALGWMGSYLVLGTSAAGPSPVLVFCVGMVFVLILTTTLILREEDLPAGEVAPFDSQLAEDGQPASEMRSWSRALAPVLHTDRPRTWPVAQGRGGHGPLGQGPQHEAHRRDARDQLPHGQIARQPHL